MTPQMGIFALGVPEHGYLELDLRSDAGPRSLAQALADLAGPESPLSSVSVVCGLRPEIWAGLRPRATVDDARSFQEDVIGVERLRMPATQHDGWLWLAGGSRGVVLDNTLRAIEHLRGTATVAEEVSGWVYRDNRDLTGFIDGTENPPLTTAPGTATLTDGPGAGTCLVLV